MDFGSTPLNRAKVLKDRPELAQRRDPQTEVEAIKPEEPRQYKFGIKLHSLTDGERTSMELDVKGGLLVQSVDADSFAEDVGLMGKDVILSINRQPVTSVDDVKRIQGTLK